MLLGGLLPLLVGALHTAAGFYINFDVFGPYDELNVALDGTTNQSSTYERLGNSRNAIYGSSTCSCLNRECSHTDLDIEPWWMVDLKKTHRISFVWVTNRGDCCNDRINGAEVRIGNSDRDGGVRNHRCASIPTMGLGETLHLNCSGMYGRYVTVTIPGRAEYLTLCHVQVFGAPDRANDTDAQDSAQESHKKETGPVVTDMKKLLKPSNAAPNVALAGTSYQSSTLGNAHSKKAIDGSLANMNYSGHCAHTHWEMEPWWTVDLMSAFKVFSVAVTVPADCGERQLTGAQIWVGNSSSVQNKNLSCGSILSVAPGDTLSIDCGEMEGRFITIFIPGREEALVICEVQVFGVPADAVSDSGNRTLGPARIPHGTSNLALKGVPSQSSNRNSYYESWKTIDGSLSSHYRDGSCSETDKGPQPWWMVDLRGQATISSVAITNRGDCCRERINGAEIRIGNSTKQGGVENPRCGTVFRMGYGETLSFNCHGMEGQYVTVTIPDRAEYMTLCEVQVYGVLTETLNTTAETERTPGLVGRSLVFPEESDSSYVLLTPENRKTLEAFTLCMRISTPLPTGRDIILFSYRTQHFDALNLWRQADGRLGFYLSGPGEFFKMPRLGEAWTHICLTWASEGGITRAYVNGVQTSDTRHYRRRHRISHGGIFMLGQDQDSRGGEFQKNESFVGEIRDLYMWDRSMRDAYIQKAFRGDPVPNGEMFDWRFLSYAIRGNVRVEPGKAVITETAE